MNDALLCGRHWRYCEAFMKDVLMSWSGGKDSCRALYEIHKSSDYRVAALLTAVTRDFAERLARGPAFALAKTKEMLNRELHMDLAAALECEEQAQALCMAHPNFREAYEAFVEKRKPRFD